MPVMRNQIPCSPAMKQGIVAALGSESNSDKPAATAAAASIRRTLSADMLHQTGFPSPFKYSPSSPISSSSSSSEEFHQTPADRDDVWRSIQNQKKKKNNNNNQESWDSILSQKKETPLLLPPPPYVRRSLSGLSDESLEICTERLGSESGSDCFSSSNCSTECLTEVMVKEQGTGTSLRGRAARGKAATPARRPLPPPIPSIAAVSDGGWSSQFQMQSRRENGRLILEAVSVSPGNYLEAKRGGGRLVLTLVRGGGGEIPAEEESVDQEVFVGMEGFPAEEEVVDDGGGVEEVKKSSIIASKKGLAMKKFAVMGNNANNATWTTATGAAAPSSFNAYEYFWRNKSVVSCGFVNPTRKEAIKNKDSDEDNNKNKNENENENNRNMVMVKGNKGEDLVPYSRGCKVTRRSLLFWEKPYCIATS